MFVVGSSKDGNMGPVIPPDDMLCNQCTVQFISLLLFMKHILLSGIVMMGTVNL
jgi:hypothetical protein